MNTSPMITKSIAHRIGAALFIGAILLLILVLPTSAKMPEYAVPKPTPTATPIVSLLPNNELVLKDDLEDYDVAGFLKKNESPLSGYMADWWAPTESLPASDAIERFMSIHNVSPKVLLTLLETQAGLVSPGDPPTLETQAGLVSPGDPPTGAFDAPFGDLTHLDIPNDFKMHLDWAARTLQTGFLGRLATHEIVLTLADGAAVVVDPAVNPGSYAVQYFYAQILGYDDWIRATDPVNGTFIGTFTALFGPPQPTNWIPVYGVSIPDAYFPWTGGEEWGFSQGPHDGGFDRSYSARVALDFANGSGGGCNPPEEDPVPDYDYWIVAARAGTVLEVDGNLVKIDHGDGWVSYYYHVGWQEMQVVDGQRVEAGQRIGHPSCQISHGGGSTGEHVHFFTKYNGSFQPAHGMVLSGYEVDEHNPHYGGDDTLTHAGTGDVVEVGQFVLSDNYDNRRDLFFCSYPDLVIPGNGDLRHDTITIDPNVAVVTSIDAVNISISHDYAGDVKVRLANNSDPSNPFKQTLMNRPGHTPPEPGHSCVADIGVFLQDDASEFVEDGCNELVIPGVYGSFKPDNPLDNFHTASSLNGPWEIEVNDRYAEGGPPPDAPASPNILNKWCLRVTAVVPPEEPEPPANSFCSFPAGGVPIPPDGQVEDILIVSPLKDIQDLNIYLDIEHTWVGDLEVALEYIPPGGGTGTTISLIDRPGHPAEAGGCIGDNIVAILDDEAQSSVEDECFYHPLLPDATAINGTFTPQGTLGVFEDELFAGTWRLIINDSQSNDGGTLNGWCLVPTFPTTPLEHCTLQSESIPDANGSNPGELHSTITIPPSGNGPITDLNVSVAIEHPWVGDLKAELKHQETDTTIELFDRPGVPESQFGCSGNDMDVTFLDQAPYGVENVCDEDGPPVIQGTFQPGDPLSDFSGDEFAGTWELIVYDHDEQHAGTLDSWCIGADTSPPIATYGDADGNGCADKVTFEIIGDDTWLGFPAHGICPDDFPYSYQTPKPDTADDVLVLGDFKGKGRTGSLFYSPDDFQWYGVDSLGNVGLAITHGGPEAIPVPADYDGDGATDIAVFYPATNTWDILNVDYNDGVYAPFNYPVGCTDCIPVPADYNGDGKAQVGAYEPGTGDWTIHGEGTTTFGRAYVGIVPMPADYSNPPDGKADYAFFDPRTSLIGGLRPTLHIYFDDNNIIEVLAPDDALPNIPPLPADYDGDGIVDIAWIMIDYTWSVEGSTGAFWTTQFELSEIPAMRPVWWIMGGYPY